MASNKWTGIRAWAGTISLVRQRSGTDQDGFSYETMLTIRSAVKLFRDSEYAWSGTGNTTLAASDYRRRVNSISWNLITAGGNGSNDEQISLNFGLDGNRVPINYSLDGVGGTMQVSGAGAYWQQNGASGSYTFNREEEAQSRNVPETPLPVTRRTLSGSNTLLLDDGSSTLTWSLSPVQGYQPRRVRVWINAFIPDTLAGGILRLIPAGRYANDTAITGLSATINDWFRTDQRTFSDNPSASSRMHSLIDIDVQQEAIAAERHRTGLTVEVDNDGDVECGPEQSPIDRMHFGDLNVSGPADARRFRITVRSAANNACWLGSPDIDYIGTITIVSRPAQREVTVFYDMMIEPFPAFEMYASVNGGPPVPLFTRLPAAGATPNDLIGDPNLRMRGESTIPCVRR